MAHDQFDNAQRVRRLNIGDAIPAKQLTTSWLATVLWKLLQLPEVAAACRDVARKLAARDGIRKSADAVERRATGK
jgi:UDP:flavonoid glycosyltransferase YjiC (YdhE family)